MYGAAGATSRHVTLSVVVCAYTAQRWTLLEAAVRSTLAQSPAPLEVLLVVDHNPGLLESAHDVFDRLGVHVMPNEGSPGLSDARNTGIRHAHADVVVFLDDDAEAEAGWLACHARHYDDPDVLGVGGSVLPRWQAGPPGWFPPEFTWVVGCSYVGQPTTTAEIRNPIGANMSFRRSALASAGGFASSLGRVGAVPRGCEETELSIRLVGRSPGGRILLDPEAVVRHYVPAHRTGWDYFWRRCWAEGQSKYDVVRLTRATEALSAERSYVTRTLANAVARQLAESARDRSLTPLRRAAVIVVGLLVTTAGFTEAGIRQKSRLTRG